MKRRNFLRNTLITTAAGVALGAAGLYAIQPRRTLLPYSRDNNDLLPKRPRDRRRVVVVGGGLAGISCAYELAQRGFDVTLVERSPNLGGRLTGWDIDVDGETTAMEHGFHGFFDQYYNLDGLIVDAGLKRNFKPVNDYPILFNDRPMESFTNTTTVFPFNMYAVVNQAHSISILDFNNPTGKLYEMMRYHPVHTFAKYDTVDLASFCKRINKPLVDVVIAPFAHTSFNQFHKYSTAEGIRFFHFFFLGNPNGMGYDQTIDDVMTSFLTPMKAELERLGCTLMTGVEVGRLIERDGRVTSVLLNRTGLTEGPAHTVGVNEVGPEWRAFPDKSGMPYFVRRDASGRFSALSGRCTHMGCPVSIDANRGGFFCPCHGARFEENGTPSAGPATEPLHALNTKLNGERLELIQPALATPELAADYVVLACDVPGLKGIVAQSELNAELVERVDRLGVADPYIVWRIWLDRELAPQYAPFYTVAGYRYIDSIAIYSQLQPTYEDWARRHRGSVIELHAYAVEEENVLPEDEVKRFMRAELDQLLPELAGARMLHEVYMMQQNFPRWAPGDREERPGIRTPINNLFLAGDFVKLDIPANLMEASCMTGRIAANQIFVAEGLRENPIPTVEPLGPLAFG